MGCITIMALQGGIQLTVKHLKGGKWTLIYTNAPESRWRVLFWWVQKCHFFSKKIQDILFSLQGLSGSYPIYYPWDRYGIFTYIWLILMVNVGKIYNRLMDGKKVCIFKAKRWLTGSDGSWGILGYLTHATVDGQNLLVIPLLKEVSLCIINHRCSRILYNNTKMRVAGGTFASEKHILTICVKVPVSKRVRITFDYCGRAVRACINYLDLFETTQLYLKALQDRYHSIKSNMGSKKPGDFWSPLLFGISNRVHFHLPGHPQHPYNALLLHWETGGALGSCVVLTQKGTYFPGVAKHLFWGRELIKHTNKV